MKEIHKIDSLSDGSNALPKKEATTKKEKSKPDLTTPEAWGEL